MKKSLLLFAVIVLSFGSLFAQDELMEKAKSGGFYAGANIGLPISDVSSFNFGFDVAYLFEVIDNLEVGGLLGYTHFVGEDGKYYDYKDMAFLPIAATARYYFADRKFFGGIDLGVAINVAGDAKTGFYARPKFGYDLGTISLIASFQNISGGSDYGNRGNGSNYISYSALNSFNVGVEFGF
jgi:hypothetical protein